VVVFFQVGEEGGGDVGGNGVGPAVRAGGGEVKVARAQRGIDAVVGGKDDDGGVAAGGGEVGGNEGEQGIGEEEGRAAAKVVAVVSGNMLAGNDPLRVNQVQGLGAAAEEDVVQAQIVLIDLDGLAALDELRVPHLGHRPFAVHRAAREAKARVLERAAGLRVKVGRRAGGWRVRARPNHLADRIVPVRRKGRRGIRFCLPVRLLARDKACARLGKFHDGTAEESGDAGLPWIKKPLVTW